MKRGLKIGYMVSSGFCVLVGLYFVYAILSDRIEYGQWVQPQQLGFVAICFVVAYMIYLSGKKDAALERKKKLEEENDK